MLIGTIQWSLQGNGALPGRARAQVEMGSGNPHARVSAGRGTGLRAESWERGEHVAAGARRRVGTVVGVCASFLQIVAVVSGEQ